MSTNNHGFFASWRSAGTAIAVSVETVATTTTVVVKDAGEITQDLTTSAKNASRILRVKSGDALDDTIVESNAKAKARIDAGTDMKSEYQEYFDRDVARAGIWASR